LKFLKKPFFEKVSSAQCTVNLSHIDAERLPRPAEVRTAQRQGYTCATTLHSPVFSSSYNLGFSPPRYAKRLLRYPNIPELV
ncbi:MAG: hypothetical protein MJA30_33890, partial [Cytophagales bacterium]|nr:hypothetical protein [Cytophagales bacterium]